MRAALAQCWAALEKRPGGALNSVSVSECERAMPDSEARYASDYTSAAIDAVDIACNLLIYIGSGEIDLIVGLSLLGLTPFSCSSRTMSRPKN